MTSVLSEAEGLINGARAKEYGPEDQCFGRAWQMWGPVLESDMPGPTKVALCLALLKVARLCETPTHRDGWVDLAGYTGLGARMTLPR